MGSVAGFEPITEGEESQAFRFRSGRQTYVIRINVTSEGFEKDAFAFGKFGRRDLPIPKVKMIGQIDDHFFCISENIPGVTLQDIPENDLGPLLAPTARVLDVIAESDLEGMSGFGPFNASGVGSDQSWQEFLTSISDFRRYDWASVSRIIDAKKVDSFLSCLEKLVAYCPETRQLIHGDFGSNNLLTDGSRITGVIDWSEAAIGDSAYDVANILYWRNWLGCMQQQAQYFESTLGPSPSLTARLLCYQLRIGLAEMYHNAMAEKPYAVAWATSRCEELISTFAGLPQ